ncbi:MAG: hypothetical protein JWL76_1248 [Thermoleophilia bacterium]|nr:hypothetical protein [Thermoleophilia bacterium]
MPTITPAAATAATTAARPVASTVTRMIGFAGAGFAAAAGLALWADNHYTGKPDASGDSPGRIDRREARELFSGADGFPAIVTFTALLAASFLYSHGKQHMTPKEFTMLRTSYWVLGGALVGTAAAPGVLRKLPAEYDPKPGTTAGATAPASNAIAGAVALRPQGS